jgi:hypothetical protein
MVALTLSAEQVRNAPREVRRWLEQQLLASLGLQPPSAEPDATPLVACSGEEAGKVLSLIQGRIPVVSVFFELGREGARTDIEGLQAFRLDDILRHTRLQSLEQLVACSTSLTRQSARSVAIPMQPSSASMTAGIALSPPGRNAA